MISGTHLKQIKNIFVMITEKRYIVQENKFLRKTLLKFRSVLLQCARL